MRSERKRILCFLIFSAVFFASLAAVGVNAVHADADETQHNFDYVCEWEGVGSAVFRLNCTDCDYRTSVVADVSDLANAATCTEDAFTVYTATAIYNGQNYMSSKIVADEGKATGHGYIKSSAAWNGDGCVFDIVCQRCGDAHSVTAEAATATNVPATCTVNAYTEYAAEVVFEGETYTDVYRAEHPGTAKGHAYELSSASWEGMECTFTFGCENCGDRQTRKAMGGGAKTEAACGQDAYTEYTATVTFGNKNYTDTHRAVENGTALEHSWDGGKVTKQPAADGNGEKTYTCSRCGGTKTETLPALEPFPIAAVLAPVIIVVVGAGAAVVAVYFKKFKKKRK